MGRCAPIVFYLTDRLLADEAVFFACGSQECEPYGQDESDRSAFGSIKRPNNVDPLIAVRFML